MSETAPIEDPRVIAASNALSRVYEGGFPSMAIREGLLLSYFPVRTITRGGEDMVHFDIEAKQAALDLVAELRDQRLADEEDTLKGIERVKKGEHLWEK